MGGIIQIPLIFLGRRIEHDRYRRLMEVYTTADGLTIEDDDYNYLSEDYTIDEYKEKYTELAAQYAEQDSDGMKMEM